MTVCFCNSSAAWAVYSKPALFLLLRNFVTCLLSDSVFLLEILAPSCRTLEGQTWTLQPPLLQLRAAYLFLLFKPTVRVTIYYCVLIPVTLAPFPPVPSTSAAALCFYVVLFYCLPFPLTTWDVLCLCDSFYFKVKRHVITSMRSFSKRTLHDSLDEVRAHSLLPLLHLPLEQLRTHSQLPHATILPFAVPFLRLN